MSDITQTKLFCPNCDFGVTLTELDEFNQLEKNDMKNQDNPFTICPNCHDSYRINKWIENSSVHKPKWAGTKNERSLKQIRNDS